MTPVWVVGASGLLGSAVLRATRQRSLFSPLPAVPLPWGGDERVFRGQVREALGRMDPERPWAVAWCAGASVTGASDESVARELRDLDLALEELRGWSSRPDLGAVFYASSAGGVYAGSASPPFTERTAPRPISPYGRGKLAAEERLRAFSAATGVRTVIGRISNLYGPGQSLAKAQGLITQLARAQLSPAPASIYVPLETTRDFIYEDDAAALVLDALERIGAEAAGTSVTKIIASHQAITISALLGHFKTLSKAAPHAMLGSSPLASYQSVDLRLRSVVWTELDRRDFVPLPAGIHAIIRTMLATVQEGAGIGGGA